MVYLTRTIGYIEQRVHLQLTPNFKIIILNSDSNKWGWFVFQQIMLENEDSFPTLWDALNDALIRVPEFIQEEAECFELSGELLNIPNAIEEFKRSEAYQNLKPIAWRDEVFGYGLKHNHFYVGVFNNPDNINWTLDIPLEQHSCATIDEAKQSAIQGLREFAIMILEQTEDLQ